MAQLKWQLGTVVEIRQETPTVRSLILEMPDWTRHFAGQHVDVRLTSPDGYQAQRSYSIASPPDEKHLMLTVERLDDGEVSPYLTEVLRVGDKVELRGPIGGYFVWNAGDSLDAGPPLLFVGGGSGIAPLMAMIRHRANSTTRVSTKLLYSSRSYEDVIFREELESLTANDATFRVVHTLTRRWPENWEGYRRRIDRAMLEEVFWPPEEKPIAYTCGPTDLVETVADLLLELGYEPDCIKTERFGPTGG